MLINIKSTIKELCKRNPRIFLMFCRITCPLRFIPRTKIKGKNNSIVYGNSLLRNCRISIIGNNNSIVINNGTVLSFFDGMIIHIIGSNNEIIIDEQASVKGLGICMEDDGNKLICGKSLKVSGSTHLAMIEGTEIKIGSDCMFSANISFRTGDSHSILDAKSKKRINPSKSILIGNHVWVGNTVLVFKGAQIGDNSIIAGGTVVVGKKFDNHCIIGGGNPSTIIKQGVTWEEQRLGI